MAGKHIKNARAPRKPKRPKQAKLFGDETYFDAVQERIPLTKIEAEAKTNLINAMIAGGKKRYKTAEGKTVDLTDNFNVRVKEAKEAAEEESDGE